MFLVKKWWSEVCNYIIISPYLYVKNKSLQCTRLLQKVSTVSLSKNRVRLHIKFYCYQILHSSNYFSIYSPTFWGTYRSGAQVFVYPLHRMRPPAMLATTDNVIESLKSEESAGTDQKLWNVCRHALFRWLYAPNHHFAPHRARSLVLHWTSEPIS